MQLDYIRSLMNDPEIRMMVLEVLAEENKKNFLRNF